MRAAHISLLLAMFLVAEVASGACTPVRLGYVNQHRPPYFLGSGSAEMQPPGASVDLIRAIAAAAGCQVVSVRLPPLRLRQAMHNHSIDAMLMDADDADLAEFALPQTAHGKLDVQRAVRMYTVIIVRAGDKAAARHDPRAWFATRRLGINNGASLAAQLRAQGLMVDDGAHDGVRNLEKLVRGRIDGYAATMVAPDNMDAFIAAKFGKQLVRLDIPFRTHTFSLAYTRRYYGANPEAVQTMWDWMGMHGHARFAELVRDYERAR